MKKKFLSILLTMVLVFSMIPSSAFAAEDHEETTIEATTEEETTKEETTEEATTEEVTTEEVTTEEATSEEADETTTVEETTEDASEEEITTEAASGEEENTAEETSEDTKSITEETSGEESDDEETSIEESGDEATNAGESATETITTENSEEEMTSEQSNENETETSSQASDGINAVADTDEASAEDASTDSTDSQTTEGKTLVVGGTDESTYTAIQDALDYIAKQDDKDGWTITVKVGEYTYFTVNQTISNLTITGEDGAVVDTSNGTIQLMGDTITLENLEFKATDTAWGVPIIKDASSNAGIFYDSMVTISDCTFTGNNAACAIWICRLNATVENCTFDGFDYAFEIINETSTVAKIDTETTTGTITIDKNTVTNCDFFIHYGVRSGITFVVTNNSVTGTPEKICASLFAWKGESITVTGNSFAWSVFGLQNAINSVTAKDFLDTNTFDEHSYVADDYYNYTTKADYSVTYYAPVIKGRTVTWSVSDAAGDMKTEFAAALEGHEHDNPLIFTTTDGEGDGVCMGLAYQALNLDQTYVDKSIVVTEGEGDSASESHVKTDGVAPGETVDFCLTTYVPDSLDVYIEYKYEDDGTTRKTPGTVKDGSTYKLVFHDEMNSSLTLVEKSIEVFVGNTQLEDSQYTLTTTGLSDDCTFEVTVDLLKLYTAGVIDEDDFGSTSVTITYTATLSKDAEPGAYGNTARVSYPRCDSEEDTATVENYRLDIFKYDQACSTKESTEESAAESTGESAAESTEGSTENGGLAGASFILCTDKACTQVVANLVSDVDGKASVEGLAAGKYYLKETEAPYGYVACEEVITVEIPDAESGEASKDYIVELEVANAAIPQTGGPGTDRYMLGGLCLLALSGTVFGFSRRRRSSRV